MNREGKCLMSEVITITAEHKAVQYLSKKDKRLAKVISTIGEISYRPHDDPFNFLVHEIIEQMLSVKAGHTSQLVARFQKEYYPQNISLPIQSL